MVSVSVPSLAFRPTLTVMIDDPEPGAAIDVRLKLTDTPAFWPAADKPMAVLKPPETAVVIVELPDWPLATLIAVGDALMLKSAPASEVTFRLTEVVCVMPSPVAVTVIG